MGATNIKALKGYLGGAPFLVVASGATMNHVDIEALRGFPMIVVNEMFRQVRPVGHRYALAHHHEHVQEAINAGWRVVTSEYDCGFKAWGQHAFRGDYFTYKTQENNLVPTPNISAIERDADDELVISACTVAEAIHFAYHLGASTVILCGVDGGSLDGEYNLRGYNGGAGTNPQHVRLTYDCLMAVVTALRAKGLRIYSLNPFVDLGLEGHRYERPPTQRGRTLVNTLNRVHRC